MPFHVTHRHQSLIPSVLGSAIILRIHVEAVTENGMASAASFSQISLLTIREVFPTKRKQSQLSKKKDLSFLEAVIKLSLWLSTHPLQPSSFI